MPNAHTVVCNTAHINRFQKSRRSSKHTPNFGDNRECILGSQDFGTPFETHIKFNNKKQVMFLYCFGEGSKCKFPKEMVKDCLDSNY